MNGLTTIPTCGPADHTAAAFRLASEGCCIVRQVVPPALLARIDKELASDFEETPLCRGPFYGDRTKRFGRLLTRSDGVAELVLHPLITGLAEHILSPWCDAIQLNVAQAIEIYPGALQQYPHRDQDMYWGEKGRIEYLVNVMWPLTPFAERNGATLLWPDSHGRRALVPADDAAPVVAEAMPGDAILFLGSTLHGAGANHDDHARRAIVTGYSLGWLKPYENPWLAYPPEVARHFPPALAAMVGYRQHRPNLGNFEGQCPSLLLGQDIPERIEAIDALRPEETAMLAEYVAAQRCDQRARSGDPFGMR